MLQAMAQPAFYPHRPDSVRVRETHTSVLFLAGDRVYKLKKDVTLPFVDQGTLERRLLLCREEVRLNRRLAPDVYLGVRSVVKGEGGLEMGGPEDPGALEYAVEMRRLPEDRSLEALAWAGKLDRRVIERIAHRIADFHDHAAPARGRYGGPVEVKARLDENFRTVLPYVGSVVDERIFAAVERFSDAFLLGRRGLLAERADRGRVREGHGDLRAEHVVIEDDAITVYDCVEFDERLRFVDVAEDLAFLVMDLERLGAGALVATLEQAYIERSGDDQLRELLAFYASYRAWVRGKVACLRLEQLRSGDPRHGELLSDARFLFALSHRFAWRARLPLVIVFCGLSGSGKSALADALSERSGLPHVSSDVVRKRLAGVPVPERARAEIYGAEFSARTYAELARRARGEVERGGGALVDATFLKRRHRARLLDELEPFKSRVLFCECRAPTAILRQRAELREEAPEHGSDATWEVIRGQFSRYERLDELPATSHLVVRTDRPIADSIDELEALVSRAIDTRPGRCF